MTEDSGENQFNRHESIDFSQTTSLAFAPSCAVILEHGPACADDASAAANARIPDRRRPPVADVESVCFSFDRVGDRRLDRRHRQHNGQRAGPEQAGQLTVRTNHLSPPNVAARIAASPVTRGRPHPQ